MINSLLITLSRSPKRRLLASSGRTSGGEGGSVETPYFEFEKSVLWMDKAGSEVTQNIRSNTTWWLEWGGEEESADTPYFKFEKDTLWMDKKGNEATQNISSNTDWKLE